MSSQVPNSTSNSSSASHDPRGKVSISPEQLSRLATLVAAGDVPVPTHLPTDQLRHLIWQVREHRRKRLVKHIARAIADDIVRSRELR